MTKVVFYKTEGVFYAFEEVGHTGYAESGEDPLCAALSAMTMLIVNAIEVSYASNVDWLVEEKTTDIKVVAKGALAAYEDDEKKRYAVGGLIQAYYYQLMDLTEEYYEFLVVEVKDELIL